jgi:NAD(P)-dependent dehydrogenase (short-subunit alcohol dehydrogenase family)
VISGRRQQVLDETVLSLKQLSSITGTHISAVCADVTKEEDAVKLFEHVYRAFGRPADVVFANAGLMLDSKNLGEESIESWWLTFVSSSHPPRLL